ncbi:unnamed protein product [Calypogeia fissa]
MEMGGYKLTAQSSPEGPDQLRPRMRTLSTLSQVPIVFQQSDRCAFVEASENHEQPELPAAREESRSLRSYEGNGSWEGQVRHWTAETRISQGGIIGEVSMR